MSERSCADEEEHVPGKVLTLHLCATMCRLYGIMRLCVTRWCRGYGTWDLCVTTLHSHVASSLCLSSLCLASIQFSYAHCLQTLALNPMLPQRIAEKGELLRGIKRRRVSLAAWVQKARKLTAETESTNGRVQSRG